MEEKPVRLASDELKLQMMKRVLLLMFGFIIACFVLATVPMMMFMQGGDQPVPVASAGSSADNKYVSADGVSVAGQPELIPPTKDYLPIEVGSSGGYEFGSLVSIVLILIVIYMVGVGLYDMYRIYLMIRRAKEQEEVLFP